MTKRETETLEAHFEQARATPPQMPAGMMDRLIADALAAQPAPALGGWRGFWRAIGGAPALGGLITATAVGFWIGVAPPSGLPDVATQIITGGDDYIVADATSLDTYTSDLTAFGWDLDEG
ncbi:MULTISPECIES: hypothetical protein [unclassified Sulfitobacter]|uniref:hypothetical protein n=1 Tax=Sulfitobacter TaxID=60136 RepID=UPI0002F16635|nr:MULTISPECIES: hypothetical protein [unclassified Sulfitobacter]